MTSDRETSAFLSFSLGPVQSFIESARTVRDLWTGSYLLAWLTYRAMGPVRKLEAEGQAAIVSPHKPQEFENSRRRAPSLPNRFLAEVSAERAEDVARECRAACIKA